MPWYIFGTLFVIPCFMGIFSYPEFVNDGTFSESKKNNWYRALPALFNVGWASVQISNMSIVNQLSRSNRRRDRLSNNRNGFTSAANISVLTFALILFLTVDDKVNQFRYLCWICLACGSCTSMFYMCTIREVPLEKAAIEKDREYKKQ